MASTVTLLLAVAAAALVFVVEGVHGFAFWNAVPIACAGAVAVSLRAPRPRLTSWRAAKIAFSVTASLAVALLHLAWHFDWGGTATGSSTAGLIFIFAPLYALILSSIVAVVVLGVSSALQAWLHRT
jgi:hypothetical protein